MSDLGGVFDPMSVPPRQPGDLQNKLIQFNAIHQSDIAEQLKSSMREVGILLPDSIKMDGTFERFSPTGKGNKKPGWLIIFPGALPAGCFGDFSRGLFYKWRFDFGRELTREEEHFVEEQMAEAKRIRDEEMAKCQAEAAKKANKVIEAAQPATKDTPYLAGKGEAPVGELWQIEADAIAEITGFWPWCDKGRLQGLCLAVPRKFEDQVVTIEIIDGESRKSFLKGGRAQGTSWMTDIDPTKPIAICEGIATALSIHRATGYNVVSASNCGNLLSIAKFIRERHLENEIMVCGDEGNGQDKAEKAAAAIGGLFVLPDFGVDKPEDASDFNDLAKYQGRDEVVRQIEAARNCKSEEAAFFDKLFEQAKEDPGVFFMPLAIEKLFALKKEDSATFETLRAKIRKTGCRVSELDKLLDKHGIDSPAHQLSQALSPVEILIELARNEFHLFHSPEGVAYADVNVNGHWETWAIDSKGFERWLVCKFNDQNGGAPSSEALKSAQRVIEGRALNDGQELEIFLRVGERDGKKYLDLCNDDWQVIEIDQEGWRLLNVSPVQFRRTKGMLPLPIPEPGGRIEQFRDFLNVRSEDDLVLAVTWLLAAISNNGPYPIMVLSGPQGSAKSTFGAFLKKLIDPNEAARRSLPQSDRDLFIAANNAQVLSFDNLSRLPAWLSDIFCSLATGGGHATRKLYSDQDETLFNATRPLILNGITNFVHRPDLADRSIFLHLHPISKTERITEDILWDKFKKQHPQMLGCLLDGIVEGIRTFPQVQIEELPRMADFAKLAIACETAYWPSGTFIKAFEGNRGEAVINVLEEDVVCSTLLAFIKPMVKWSGTATELFDILTGRVPLTVSDSPEWPKSPRALSGRLIRSETFLSEAGLKIEHMREGKERKRVIYLSFTEQEGFR